MASAKNVLADRDDIGHDFYPSPPGDSMLGLDFGDLTVEI